MKKLLILAYDFPPYVSVGGLRPYYWYKHLKEFGVEPVVIARQWNNKYGNHLDYIAPSETTDTEIETTEHGTIIRTPYSPNLANRIMFKYGDKKYKFIRKAVSAYYEFTQWFLPVGTKIQIYKAAKQYLKQNKVDAIIATGEPFILFRYASFLSKKYNIPWIADYRDLWTQNKFRSSNKFLKLFNSFNESRSLRNVYLILTVSVFLKYKISSLIENITIKIIANGFDSEVVQRGGQIRQSKDMLIISYAGTLYSWHPVNSFLNILEQFVKNTENRNLQINFYGLNNEEELKKIISKKYVEIKDLIHFFPKLPLEQLFAELKKGNMLLLFNDYAYTGTKIYDYLAVKRKILFCYSNDPEAEKLKQKYYNIDDNLSLNNHLQEDIIKETNSGIIVKDSAHLYRVLQKLYKEFARTGKIECDSQNIEKYSRKIQVKKLAEIINKNL